MTLDLVVPNRAEFPQSFPQSISPDPDDAVAILENGHYGLPGQFREPPQCHVLPTSKSGLCTDPEACITTGEKSVDDVAGQLHTCGWLPSNESNAIKSQNAEFGSEPQIAIRRLSERSGIAFERAVAQRPCGMRVLVDVQR